MSFHSKRALWHCLLICVCGVSAHAQTAQLAQGTPNIQSPAVTLEEVTVVSTSPVGSTTIPLNKFPGNVQTLSGDALQNSSSDLTQQLNAALGSVHINDTQGNAFAADLNYRGFTASPVLGTPQGLSVYLDGMRINEPFGDVVSWDLLPQIAIEKVTVIPGSNPVYGLNTLGGAIAMTTKNGNTFNGTEVRAGTGSFGRANIDLQHGSHTDSDNLYVAATVTNESGWATYNPSQVRQLFGKYSSYGNNWESSVSITYADNLLFGNQAVPLSMLDQAAQGYSHSDYSGTQNATINLQLSLEADTSNTYAGNLYLRSLSRNILNSNINNPIIGSTNNPTCVNTADCPASNLLAKYTQDIAGLNLQWTNTDPIDVSNTLSSIGTINQTLTVGLNTEFSNTSFSNSGQDAWVDANRAVVGADSFTSQASVQSSNQRIGLFATSTLDLTSQLSLTLSGRYDYATVSLSGLSCINNAGLCNGASSVANGQLADVSGNHSYQRFNPSLGVTYLLDPHLIAFANYAEGFRTPSAIELACADPTAPCSGVPNAFGADPELQAVVSRTYELGLRGNLGKRLVWRTAYFLSMLDNDILFNQSSLNTGYFSNVGQTQRQGVELGLDGHIGRIDYAVDLDWLAATYQSAFAVANQNNSAASVAVTPGDTIPGMPQWMFKGRINYALTEATRLGLAIQAQGSAYARGDDNNLDHNGTIPGYAVIRFDLNYSLNKAWNIYGGVNNLLDAHYASYASLASNNLGVGVPEQFRAPGAPRAYFAGIQARF